MLEAAVSLSFFDQAKFRNSRMPISLNSWCSSNVNLPHVNQIPLFQTCLATSTELSCKMVHDCISLSQPGNRQQELTREQPAGNIGSVGGFLPITRDFSSGTCEDCFFSIVCLIRLPKIIFPVTLRTVFVEKSVNIYNSNEMHSNCKAQTWSSDSLVAKSSNWWSTQNFMKCRHLSTLTKFCDILPDADGILFAFL
jgi:hypothetical protein